MVQAPSKAEVYNNFFFILSEMCICQEFPAVTATSHQPQHSPDHNHLITGTCSHPSALLQIHAPLSISSSGLLVAYLNKAWLTLATCLLVLTCLYLPSVFCSAQAIQFYLIPEPSRSNCKRDSISHHRKASRNWHLCSDSPPQLPQYSTGISKTKHTCFAL